MSQTAKVLKLVLPVALLAFGMYNLITMPSAAFAQVVIGEYSVETENSLSGYRGVRTWLTTGNAALNGGYFSSATLWAIDENNCNGRAWVEAGWTRTEAWGGDLRYKFMYKIAPSCVWSAGSSGLGSPAINSAHDYELRFCNECIGTRWK